ncbi:hypothetical protein D3C87_1550850 [compost metagenome]
MPLGDGDTAGIRRHAPLARATPHDQYERIEGDGFGEAQGLFPLGGDGHDADVGAVLLDQVDLGRKTAPAADHVERQAGLEGHHFQQVRRQS